MALCSGTSQAPLLKLDYDTLRNQWQETLNQVGLGPKLAVLYQLRHTGPSHHRLYKYRSLEEVKRRGRWESDKSVKRYEAHAKINQEWHRIPASIQRAALKASREFNQVVPKLFYRKLGLRTSG